MHTVSNNFTSALQGLIPVATSSQKHHMNMGVILISYGDT